MGWEVAEGRLPLGFILLQPAEQAVFLPSFRLPDGPLQFLGCQLQLQGGLTRLDHRQDPSPPLERILLTSPQRFRPHVATRLISLPLVIRLARPHHSRAGEMAASSGQIVVPIESTEFGSMLQNIEESLPKHIAVVRHGRLGGEGAMAVRQPVRPSLPRGPKVDKLLAAPGVGSHRRGLGESNSARRLRHFRACDFHSAWPTIATTFGIFRG
jgi:hypothetical protein